MKSAIYSWAVSAAALGAGMLCVLSVWSLISGGDPTADQNRQRFAELSSQEQSDLRNKAAAFIGSANQPELTRLQTIHAAVEENPQLLTRLRFLDDFLPSVDPETQASLAPNGEFADDWAEKVQQLANDDSVTDEKFRFPSQAFGIFKYRSSRSRSIEVNGAVYEQFLDQIVNGNWDVSPEFQEFINGDDRTLRRLFKGISVARRLANETPGESTDRAFNLARQLLLPAELQKSSERLGEAYSRSRGDDQQASGPDRMKKFQQDLAAYGGLSVVDAGLWNSHRSFLKQYDAREALSPEDFTQHFKRAEQLNLMTMDPEDAAQEVTARLVREKNVSDPVIAKVAEFLGETRKLVDDRKDELRRQMFPGRWSESGRDEGRRGPGRSGERGPEDRGPGERNLDGRGPGGRGPGERGPGGRDGGGGRGPDGREFGGRDRGPGGPPRNQNEDRDQR